LNDGTLDKLIGEDYAKTLRNDVELLEAGYPVFDKEEYLEAMVSPVFFGSAVNNFGVRELLDGFIEIAPAPRGRTN
jgi:peptide chain release factor 3